jgi:hypothetical protein
MSSEIGLSADPVLNLLNQSSQYSGPPAKALSSMPPSFTPSSMIYQARLVEVFASGVVFLRAAKNDPSAKNDPNRFFDSVAG